MMIKVTIILQLITLGHFCLLGCDSLQYHSGDFDDLRMSKDGFHGYLNYHTVKPDKRSPGPNAEKLSNHIGKLSTPFPQLITKRPVQEYTRPPQILMSQREAPITSRPQMYQSQRAKISQQSSSSDGSSIGSDDGGESISRGNCDWMSLSSFKNVSLETGELIVRDEDEQPCYLLSVRGFIKWNEDAYFPLSNFQFHPRLYRFILTGRPSDGANVRSSYLNCSLLTSDGSQPSSSMRYSPLLKLTTPFKEEIIIRTKCGYLVLQIHGDGFHLTLDSLSFYQDPSVAQMQQQLDKAPRETVPRTAPPQIESEHLVFSSAPASATSPLLMIPLTSRYTCQNRVALKGNSSVQLILDKFELQRLAFSSQIREDLSELSSNNNNQSGFVSTKTTPRSRRQTMIGDWKTPSHSKGSTVRRRETRDAHVKVNFPSVIRCPNSPNPYNPLTTMMDLKFSQGLNETLSKMIADRWMPARSSTAAQFIPPSYGQMMGWIIWYLMLPTLRYII